MKAAIVLMLTNNKEQELHKMLCSAKIPDAIKEEWALKTITRAIERGRKKDVPLAWLEWADKWESGEEVAFKMEWIQNVHVPFDQTAIYASRAAYTFASAEPCWGRKNTKFVSVSEYCLRCADWSVAWVNNNNVSRRIMDAEITRQLDDLLTLIEGYEEEQEDTVKGAIVLTKINIKEQEDTVKGTINLKKTEETIARAKMAAWYRKAGMIWTAEARAAWTAGFRAACTKLEEVAEEAVEEESISNKLFNAAETELERAVARIAGERESEDFIHDVLLGGCANGTVGELIYYSDTIAFYRRHKKDIQKLVTELMSDCGEDSMKGLFGDNFDAEDPFCEGDQNQNLLAWFGFEEALKTLADRIELDI